MRHPALCGACVERTVTARSSPPPTSRMTSSSTSLFGRTIPHSTALPTVACTASTSPHENAGSFHCPDPRPCCGGRRAQIVQTLMRLSDVLASCRGRDQAPAPSPSSVAGTPTARSTEAPTDGHDIYRRDKYDTNVERHRTPPGTRGEPCIIQTQLQRSCKVGAPDRGGYSPPNTATHRPGGPAPIRRRTCSSPCGPGGRSHQLSTHQVAPASAQARWSAGSRLVKLPHESASSTTSYPSSG